MRIDDLDNITELISDRYFGILLDDADDLKNIEYRVLTSQKSDWGATLYQCLLNGKIELFYLTGEYKKLADLLPGMSERQVCKVIRQLCESVCEVKENSFLTVDALLLDADKVYFDTKEGKVKLIYLPIDGIRPGAHTRFGQDLYDLLLYVAEMGKCVGLKADLLQLRDRQGLAMDAEQILHYVKELGEAEEIAERPKKEKRNRIRLTAADGSGFVVDQAHFILGRKAEAVDGVIPNNRRVGRVHCRLDYVDDGYVVTDLKSLNGTFVNEERLVGEGQHRLKSGDVLRMADVTFKVTDMAEEM